MSNESTMQRGNTSTHDPAATATGSNATATMQVGSLYPGIVLEVDLVTNLLKVQVQGIVLKNCDFLAGVGAAYLGIDIINLPPVGSNVLVWYWPGHSYVLGTGPKYLDGGDTGCWGPPISGDGNFDILEKAPTLAIPGTQDERPVAPGLQLPIDMLPGEWAADSGIGPVIRVLYNFTQMAAGDLAKIETHLLNDMVRIVDNEFRHHHVGGDDLIWSDGEHNTREEHFTSYLYEAEGKDKPNATLADSDGVGKFKGPDENGEPNKYNATGRWRYSRYIGFLGDMIHTWVTKPTEVLSNTMKEAFRTCNFRQWIGADGTYFIQAGTAVQIEVNPVQIVPAIEKSMKEPNFNPEEEQIKLDQKFLKLWGTGPKWDDLKVACWQMRAYLRYIPLWHSLERFKQLEASGYCRIPTQKEMSGKSWDPTCGEEDKVMANPQAIGKYDSGYAAISMTNQGDLSMVSAAGSIVMANGNIQIVAPGNVDIKAGSSVYLQGKQIIGNALKEINFWSCVGGISMKARAAFHLLCERGRIWLKSDAKKKQDPAEEDFPDSLDKEKIKPPAYEFISNGIVLDASQSQVYMYGQDGITVETKGEGSDILIRSGGKDSDIMMVSDGGFTLRAFKSIAIRTYTIFFVYATRVLFHTNLLKIGKSILIKGGSILCKGMMHIMSIISKGGYIGPGTMVGKKEDIEDPDLKDEGTEEAPGFDVVQPEAESGEPWSEDTLKWNECYKEEFDEAPGIMKTPNLGYTGDLFARTTNDPLACTFHCSPIFEDYENFSPSDTVCSCTIGDWHILPGPRTTAAMYAFPGRGQQMWYYTGGEPMLHADMESHFTENNIGGLSKLKQMPYKFWFQSDDTD